MSSNGVWSTDRVGGFCIALASGLLLGWLWATKPASLGEIDWLAVMTAFGTVGSAAGAVGIAYWQHRLNEKERYVRATHAAAGSYLALGAMVGELEELRGRISFAGRSGTSLQNYDTLILRVEAIRSSYVLPDPHDLDPLKGYCGQKLASALTQLTLVSKLMRRSRFYFEDGGSATADRTNAFMLVDQVLHAVIQLMRFVGAECQQVALPLDSPYGLS